VFKQHTDNIGYFREQGFTQEFTYRFTKDTWALKHALMHEIDVNGGVRFAHVKKTRAWIAVDEDGEGKPVLECWKIKRFEYDLK
jgi:hypothetical protein